jgi:hypothetical protein
MAWRSLVACLFLGACGGEGAVPSSPAMLALRIVVARDTLNAIGQSQVLSAVLVEGNTRTSTDGVTWSSLAPSILTVDATGKATARGSGRAVVVASRGALADSVAIICRQVLASLRNTWAAETLFVGDSIVTSVTGVDSNGISAPLPELPTFTLSGTNISQLPSGAFRANSVGSSSVTVKVVNASLILTLFVEGPFSTVSAGNVHSCSLSPRGAVYCWGYGIGTATNVGTNRPQVVPALPPVAGLDAGFFHTCAWTQSGDVYCWGRSSPVSKVAVPEPAISLSAGYDYTCTLSASGATYCWGANQFGQAGVAPVGANFASVATPTRTAAPALKSVSAGQYQTCGLTAVGEMLCWGAAYGTSPVRVAAPRLFRVADSGGGVCGIVTDGSVYCANGVAPGIASATDISRASSFACAILPDASAACWGDNGYGQFGNGTSTANVSIQVPTTAVSGNLRFKSISAGSLLDPGAHTCAITVDGILYCWGGNLVGEIGAPFTDKCFQTYVCNFLPTRVTRQRNVSS